MVKQMPYRNRVDKDKYKFKRWRMRIDTMKPKLEEINDKFDLEGTKPVSLKFKIEVPFDFVDHGPNQNQTYSVLNLMVPKTKAMIERETALKRLQHEAALGLLMLPSCNLNKEVA